MVFLLKIAIHFLSHSLPLSSSPKSHQEQKKLVVFYITGQQVKMTFLRYTLAEISFSQGFQNLTSVDPTCSFPFTSTLHFNPACHLLSLNMNIHMLHEYDILTSWNIYLCKVFQLQRPQVIPHDLWPTPEQLLRPNMWHSNAKHDHWHKRSSFLRMVVTSNLSSLYFALWWAQMTFHLHQNYVIHFQ